ncbi:MAG: (Fe-S)-binding protein [Spirochaetes bacterium]|nr:(Fe-S)-binding protein [Spirochaetota bacterium]
MKNSDKTTEVRIRRIINKKKGMIKLSLKVCVHCSICSESCFLYQSSRHDPTYTPSYKAINSIGRLYKKKGRVSEKEYDEIRELIWEKCVLCTRCYCPVGIDIPMLIASARSICREKGIFRTYDTGESKNK